MLPHVDADEGRHAVLDYGVLVFCGADLEGVGVALCAVSVSEGSMEDKASVEEQGGNKAYHTRFHQPSPPAALDAEQRLFHGGLEGVEAAPGHVDGFREGRCRRGVCVCGRRRRKVGPEEGVVDMACRTSVLLFWGAWRSATAQASGKRVIEDEEEE